MYKLLLVSITVAALLITLSIPVTLFAQNNKLQSPVPNTITTETTPVAANDSSFDWRWLIPLFGLPLLLLAFRDKSDSEHADDYRRIGTLTGIKGGRAKRDGTTEHDRHRELGEDDEE